MNDIKAFVKKVNITVYARSEEDVDLDSIKTEVNKLSASRDTKDSNSNNMFEIPAPLSSAYTPVKPHADIDLQEREKFWKEASFLVFSFVVGPVTPKHWEFYIPFKTFNSRSF